jgi:hypothetical protein
MARSALSAKFGNTNTEPIGLRVKRSGMLRQALVERLQHAQAAGEIGEVVDTGMNYSGRKDQ